MAREDLQTATDRLYAAPLESFVAERTREAKALRAGGDKAGADEVAKLAKPTAAAWALNHLAREEPGVVGAWLAAAEELREASTHAKQVGGDAVRAAMAEHRDATSRLLDLAGQRAKPGGRPLSEAMLERVRSMLQAATADAGLAEELEAGRLTEERPPAEVVRRPAGGARSETKAKRRPGGKAKAKPRPKRDPEAAARKAELKRRVSAARKEARRLRKEADRRDAAARAADAGLEEARRTLTRREAEAQAAGGAVDDAEAAASAAERELARLEKLQG